ncbi:MAG: hypothetical protein HKN29_03730 [Rhodothermales bacterium]|nr:hypothetical protein [Rhodothermales bacterium]
MIPNHWVEVAAGSRRSILPLVIAWFAFGCASTTEFTMPRGNAVADTIRAHAPVKIELYQRQQFYYLSNADVVGDSLRMQFMAGVRPATVPLSEVISLSFPGARQSMQVEGILIGAIIGGVLGGALGSTSSRSCEPRPDEFLSCFGEDFNQGAATSLGVLLGVFGGGFVGGALGGRGYPTTIVYRLRD